jgi:hypothetical protein
MLQKRTRVGGVWGGWGNVCNISSGACSSGGSYNFYYYTVTATGVQEMYVGSDSNGVVSAVAGHGVFSN